MTQRPTIHTSNLYPLSHTPTHLNMDQPTKSNRQSNWIIRTSMKVLPWLLLIHNLCSLVFGNSFARSISSLATSNFTGLAYLLVMQCATDRGLVSTWVTRMTWSFGKRKGRSQRRMSHVLMAVCS